MKIDEMDPSVPMISQLQQETGPVTLINTVFVPRENRDEFLELWRDDASFMKAQPGFISTQLHQGTADSQMMVNVAVWESTESLFRAFSNPEFQQKSAKYPDGIIAYPHVYEKVAVDGVCTA
ncbi:antibiotic biosynthesis monooxygenase family protein [Phytoactinopolyspora mesophila]|uniref:Antibiotic biosynthesis monooxygenase n=1 Tax=Phytoactinopolyspora mesophila TaxID=2650750 RepID=A0A7K3M1V5_9ACTN|nr:antibiotic biosynthesis monooxygenase family protein [Phytoactinopolyspora mesophila]NDL56882.1 antibiotic biosynthesis monooxygenase [Phytoactinopolyspora mesophila]